MSQAAENSVWLNQIQVAIGVVGGFLLVLTLFYSREAAMAASKAAVAAQESADTMVDAERTNMLISELQITGLANRPETDGNVILGVTYKFTNYGRSPALLKKVTVAISLVQDLPSQPEYQQEQALRFTSTVNGWYGLATPGDARVHGSRVRAVHSGEANIWVFGYLEYEDVFGKGHTNRFAYRLPLEVDSTVNFRPDGPDTYHEYT